MRFVRYILPVLLIAPCIDAAEQRYAVTLRVEQVQGTASLRGAEARGVVTLDAGASMLWGQATQIVYGGKTYTLRKPAKLNPVRVTITGGDIRLRSSNANVDAGMK